MITPVYISELCDGYIIFKAPYPAEFRVDMAETYDLELRITDGRIITADQRRKIYATFGDISDYTGYVPEETKHLMKCLYVAATGNKYFSLSDTDLTTARLFLQFLIEFCVSFGIPCRDSLLERTPDIGKYVYSCLINKVCCICGKEAELHHVDRVGMGRNRKRICHIGMEALSLCRVHHNEAHDAGQETFNKKYHIFGVKIDKTIAKIYKLRTE